MYMWFSVWGWIASVVYCRSTLFRLDLTCWTAGHEDSSAETPWDLEDRGVGTAPLHLEEPQGAAEHQSSQGSQAYRVTGESLGLCHLSHTVAKLFYLTVCSTLRLFYFILSTLHKGIKCNIYSIQIFFKSSFLKQFVIIQNGIFTYKENTQ